MAFVRSTLCCVLALAFTLAGRATAAFSQQSQTASPAPASPQALPNPAMTAPLQLPPPHTFEAGPFGSMAVNGMLSGMGMVQSNRIPPDAASHWDVSNAQVVLQKTTGWWQVYLQGGAYNIPDLGVPFVSTANTLTDFYGPLPVAYLKLVKGNFSAQAGKLSSLLGAEYTFSFENPNIERGLLWNQENAVNRGVQLNETVKKLSVSASWNDGFYSNRYTWISGSLAYAFNAASTLSFTAGGNAGHTRYTSTAVPIQNNSSIYVLIYTYSHGNWYVEPYWQFTNVPTDAAAGIAKGASTDGGAVLVNYNFKRGFSLGLRPEYIAASGDAASGSVNLLYGPGSKAFSLTATPGWQRGGFFIRAEGSVVDARSLTVGDAFGATGNKGAQARGVIESGFLF